MKTALICIWFLALASLALGQDQTPSPAATASAFTVTTSITPNAPTASPSATAKDDLESRIERKVNKKGFSITIGDDDKDKDKDHDHDRVRVDALHLRELLRIGAAGYYLKEDTLHEPHEANFSRLESDSASACRRSTQGITPSNVV